MGGIGTLSRKRVNITLPVGTLRILDRLAPKGGRSEMINQAVQRYAREMARAKLKKRIREGSLANAQRDLELAREWSALDSEAWPDS